MSVLENDLYSAIQTKLQLTGTTVDSTNYAVTGSPAFEGSTTSMPNSRNVYFINLDGVDDYYTVDLSTLNIDSGIINIWIKPDSTQTLSSDYRILSTYDSTTQDGIELYFQNTIDDFRVDYYINNSATGRTISTSGMTWSIDDVLHMVIMWNKTGGLDNGKSLVLYINNTLVASSSTTWSTTSSDKFSSTSRVGTQWNGGQDFDGGIYDYAVLDYDSLAASYTDAEIVQALYSNTYGAGGTHKFTFELTGSPTSPGLTIAARKLRLMTNTAGTATTALEIDSSQTVNVPVKLEVDGTLETSGAVTFNADSEDLDFTINKNTSGTALVYDAGLDETRIGTPGTNYTAIEADGTIEFNGDATVWNDLQFNIETGRVAASNAPDWDGTFTTNTGCYKFDVNDYIDLGANEMPHDWKEASGVYPHVHIALDGANSSGSSQYVKFKIYLAYADVNDVYTETDKDIEIEIPNGTADLTHLLGSSSIWGLTGLHIGCQVNKRIKRIAATTGTEYPNHIFITQIGIHYEIDTVGSRGITTK